MKFELLEIKVFFTAIFTALNSTLGLLATPIYILILLNTMDYITGIWASTKRGDDITSQQSYAGIKKKVGMYILIVIGFILDWLLQFSLIALHVDFNINFHLVSAITVWLIANELISLLENLYNMGVAMPTFLIPLINKIKNVADMNSEEEREEEKEISADEQYNNLVKKYYEKLDQEK